MLQATVARFPRDASFSAPIVVGGEDHRFLINDQLLEVGCSPATIILEPEGRNTAAAIALAAHVALSMDRDAVLVVAPSDHVIADTAAFAQAIAFAVPAAHAGKLVTFGIQAQRPETGYGYIEIGPQLLDLSNVHAVVRFVEKPDGKRAQEFFESGRYAWNGGIFVLTAHDYLAALAEHAPAIAAACTAAMAAATIDAQFTRPERMSFLSAPSVSIDYAVMECTKNAAVVPVEMGWSDVGSWSALWDLAPHDSNGNCLDGDVVAIESNRNLVRIDRGPAVALVGIDDMIVVSTRDSVLVVPRSRAQDVKLIVDELKCRNSSRHSLQPVVHRPWGTYETTDSGDRFRTKRIIVKPGEKLSLQMHYHRSEHWIVVSGTAVVTIDGEEQIVGENQSVYIAAGSIHRLENAGKIPLHLIEVQCGAYLDEDDIVRFEDKYARTQSAAE